MVEGAYKKLKSYYFYDKTLLYIKEKIAVFENDQIFEGELKKIAMNITEQNMEYFVQLIEKMEYRVLPKKLKSVKEKTNVVKSTIECNKNIEKINFFIDLPIQLLIVDVLWMLFIGKIKNDKIGNQDCSYAGRFKKGVFREYEKDLFKGIEFKSNRCFKPYYESYSEWRDKAFDIVKRTKPSKDLVMMSLDLKSFYYSVEFEFEKLSELLKKDDRLKEIQFITNIIEIIYQKYTNQIEKNKKNINNSKGKNIFPIGLLSPIVLREIYLEDFDKLIYQKIKPMYYGRYVDDMLIVTEANGCGDYLVNDFVSEILVGNQVIKKSEAGINRYEFEKYSNLKIQQEKIKCFFFEKNKSDILVNFYEEEIKVNSSEANLLPDMSLLNKSFNSALYSFRNEMGSTKIRELCCLKSNNYAAVKLINGLKEINKNTQMRSKENEWHFERILEFYKDSQGIEFSSSWTSIFELFVQCSDKKRANLFYKNIKEYISILSFENLDIEEIKEEKKEEILKKLQKNLENHLDIAISLAIALNFTMGRFKKHKELSKIFRNTNFLNHHLTTIPLLNYLSEENIKENSLVKLDTKKFFSENSNIKLDDKKLKWSPRFIHLNEFYLCVFFTNIINGKIIHTKDNAIFEKYLKYNNLSKAIKNPIIKNDMVEKNKTGVKLKKIKVLNMVKKNIKVGVANIDITEEQVLCKLKYPDKLLTVENKTRLFKLLNSAQEENVDFLVFPEFYLPFVWLNDIVSFAKNHGITIVTGLQYLTNQGKAYNTMCIVKSTVNKTGFKNVLMFFREKNFYAPAEKIEISRKGYSCMDTLEPIYHIISDPNIEFSTMLCFEFTDIISRANMKAQIDMLVVPQFNRDTPYFSSIVESAARDLHCFIVQANTSRYGDSRITAPLKSAEKNIVQVKGGVNDVIMISEVKIKKLRDFQKKYKFDSNQWLENCFNCKRKCSKCDKKNKSNIKPIPPNFNRK